MVKAIEKAIIFNLLCFISQIRLQQAEEVKVLERATARYLEFGLQGSSLML